MTIKNKEVIQGKTKEQMRTKRNAIWDFVGKRVSIPIDDKTILLAKKNFRSWKKLELGIKNK